MPEFPDSSVRGSVPSPPCRHPDSAAVAGPTPPTARPGASSVCSTPHEAGVAQAAGRQSPGGQTLSWGSPGPRWWWGSRGPWDDGGGREMSLHAGEQGHLESLPSSPIRGSPRRSLGRRAVPKSSSRRGSGRATQSPNASAGQRTSAGRIRGSERPGCPEQIRGRGCRSARTRARGAEGPAEKQELPRRQQRVHGEAPSCLPVRPAGVGSPARIRPPGPHPPVCCPPGRLPPTRLLPPSFHGALLHASKPGATRPRARTSSPRGITMEGPVRAPAPPFPPLCP